MIGQFEIDKQKMKTAGLERNVNLMCGCGEKREREREREGGRVQPECFHGDWLSDMPLIGQMSLTRRSICQAASAGSQSGEGWVKKKKIEK